MDYSKTQIKDDLKKAVEIGTGANLDKFEQQKQFTSIDEPKAVSLPNEDQRTVIGVFLSRSKKVNAEYWPVRMGTNTIGSGENNDIILLEEKVSLEHAKLNARRNLETNDIELSIVDISSNGILVDGKDPGYFNGIACKNESKIKIGGYELILLYADTDKLGLKTNPDFKAKGGGPKAFNPNASSTAIDYD